MRARVVACLVALGLLSAPATSSAWGSDGHRLVALLALQYLSPAARAEVDKILALEAGATLESISTWADEHRSPATARWHYVNFPEGDCRYAPARDCSEGQCVVAAIEKQADRLRQATSDAERLQALKYLTHLVADVHQPLHAGGAGDRGGNKHQVRAFGRGTNLHVLWDSGLIENRPGGTALLLLHLRAMPAPSADTMKAADWAEESCVIVQSPGFYPESRNLGALYALHWDAVLRHRLSDAAHRLARLLNQSLAP